MELGLALTVRVLSTQLSGSLQGERDLEKWPAELGGNAEVTASGMNFLKS